MAMQWVNRPEGGADLVDVPESQQNYEQIMANYGYSQPNWYGYEDAYGGNAAFNGQTKEQLNKALTARGYTMPHFNTPQEVAASRDPKGPGNGEGGSDFSNILKLAGMVVGGGMGLQSLMGSGLFGGAGAGLGETATLQSLNPGYEQMVGGYESGGGMDFDLSEFFGPGQADTGYNLNLSGSPELGNFSDPYGQGWNLGNSSGSVIAQNGGWGGMGQGWNTGSSLMDLIKQYGGDAAKALKALGGGGNIFGGGSGGGSGRSPLGDILGGGASYLAQQQQMKALMDMAERQRAEEMKLYNEQIGRGTEARTQAQGIVGPYQQRLESSFSDPNFTMAKDPGFMDALNLSSKATLHGLSMQGNPAGSPNAWAQSQSDNMAKFAYPALQDYRKTNANVGFSGPYASVAANPVSANRNSQVGFDTQGNALAAGAQGWNALGNSIDKAFNPQSPLENILAQMNNKGSSIFGA